MGGVERCGTLRLSARVLRARAARSRQASGSRAGGGASGGGREGWRVRREGLPGQGTEVVKMMCADVGLQLKPWLSTARAPTGKRLACAKRGVFSASPCKPVSAAFGRAKRPVLHSLPTAPPSPAVSKACRPADVARNTSCAIARCRATRSPRRLEPGMTGAFAPDCSGTARPPERQRTRWPPRSAKRSASWRTLRGGAAGGRNARAASREDPPARPRTAGAAARPRSRSRWHTFCCVLIMNAGASVPEPRREATLAVARFLGPEGVAAELAPPEPRADDGRGGARGCGGSLLRAANLTGFKHVSRNNSNKPFQASLMRGGHLDTWASSRRRRRRWRRASSAGLRSPSRPRARRARSPVPTRHCAGTR